MVDEYWKMVNPIRPLDMAVWYPASASADDSADLFRNIMGLLEQIANYYTASNAPVSRIYDFMLGRNSKSTYEQWTTLFNQISTYEGSWDKRNKMLFVELDEKGEKGGMVSRIVENNPIRFVSIQQYGLLKGDKEITEGPEVDKWANGFENYTFEENNGTTTVTVELDTTEDFIDYMKETYPKALGKLKELCEK